MTLRQKQAHWFQLKCNNKIALPIYYANLGITANNAEVLRKLIQKAAIEGEVIQEDTLVLQYQLAFP